MKTILQFLTVLFITVSLNAQETVVNLSMQPSYANQVYYKLSTETETSFAANSWDIAFLRTSAMAIAVRVNGGAGITVFEASNNIADWSTINIANEGNWTELNNSDTTWNIGAFDNASNTTPPFGYGWGQYTMANHHVVGTIVFVLKYADGTYRKLIVEDFYSAYTIKYATWNAGTATWGADQTVTIANTSNPSNKFNYYSLQNNTEVIAEPAISDWDLKFTQYYTQLADGSGGTIPYLVTGVLHNEKVTIAENDEPTGMLVNPSLTYSTDINTIGYDWKVFNMGDFSYYVDTNKAFYVKYDDGTIYRLYFTSFEGSSTGNISFAFENVTTSLGLDDVLEAVSFGVYPNPSTDKKINVVYDVNKLGSNKNKVEIYAISGQKVFETAINSTAGFYNKTLDLSSLRNGIYVLQFTSGSTSISKKLILN